MKRRLLFLFAVFMVATSVGWGQGTSNPVYYKVTSGSGGDGSLGSPLVKNSLDEALTAANDQSDSVVIILPKGTYASEASALSITHSSLAIVGEGDTSTVKITSPWDITLAGGGSVSFEGVHLSANTSGGRGVVDIKSSNTTVSFEECKITIEGKGGGDSGLEACFGVVSQVSVDKNTINFTRSRLYMSQGYERGLVFREGAGHTLNCIDSQIDGPSAKGEYPYVIGIGSWPSGTSCKEPITYNIQNSTIDINYYAVFTNNQSGADVPVNITIDNCNITAWSALYLRGDNAGVTFPHHVNITNTRMFGRSYQNGPSDGFGTIVFEVCPQLDLTMDTRCSVVSENMAPIADPPTYMCVADIRQTNGTWKFVRSGTSKCTIQSKNDVYAPVLFFKKNNSSLNIIGAEDVEFKAQNEKSCIVSFNADNSLKNAASSLEALLTNTTLEEGDKVVFPEGEYTLPMTLSLDKSLTIEGAGQSQTIVNGHIFVNSPSEGSVTLTASDMTLKGNNNGSAHGLIGMIGAGKDIVKLTNCKLDGGSVTAQTAAVGVRMESVGAELSLTNTDIDVNYYGIGLRNKEQTVNIEGGILTAWGAIMTSAGNMSPSDGTLANTNTRITAKNATFISRTLAKGKSNGYGAIVFQQKYNGVTAEFTNCELRTVEGLDPLLHAAQSSATDIRSYGNKITFTGCTLSSQEGTNNLPDEIGYLHAGVIRLGCKDTDDQSVLANNTITITNSTLNGKEGESWVYSYRKKEAKAYDKLTINGTVYDPASGLICYGEPDIQNKIDNAIAGETISVPAGEYAGFDVKTNDIQIKGVYGETIIKGVKQYSGSSVACVSANNVTLKNLSFKSSADESNRPTGLFVGRRTIVVDSCIFEDKLLQTGLYSEPGSAPLEATTLLVQNCTFNVFDKNLLLTAGRINATVKNNVFTDSDISVAKNDGSNVVESNEFRNCIVKVEDGVTFLYNKMYPGDQTYVYSIRPNNFTGTVDASNNYWGSDTPNFSALIDKGRAPEGSVNYFPYYSDAALSTLIYKMVTISEDTVWGTPHPNQKVTILDGAILTLSAPMSLDTVTMKEGAQIKSNLADQTGSVTAKSLRFSPNLSGTEWKAFGMPFTSAVINNSKEEEISAPSQQSADNGIWFAKLKDNKTPEFVVDENAFGMAGLWAANGDTYTISSKGAFEFKTLEEPTAPTETGTFLMCSNPNTFTITLKQSAYILTANGTSFEQEANPEIKPFQSFVLTDAKTLSTLRSLRIGDGVVTGNQTIEPVDGYYVTTDRGAIVIHTPEPMDVVIIGMNGKVAYRGEVTDGRRIMVPSGIYAVNGQLVRVK
ncbi:hypothetical protein [Parabacteroides sp.]